MMLRLMNVCLVFIIVASAIGVIYSKHENRMLYAELRELEAKRDNLNVDWGRLQLEQSTWATHGRVENEARKRLNMRNVDYAEVVIVKP
ncbi:MAG: cell division protein FtsL [Thioalkalispiraceae bacterium]|jgi:cell division protein FtsL